MLGLGSVMLVMLLGQSRVFYSMSRDGLIGPWAGKVHPRFRTPYLSTIYVGIIVAIITGTFPIQILGELVNIGTLLAFVLVCVGRAGSSAGTGPISSGRSGRRWCRWCRSSASWPASGLMATLPGRYLAPAAVWLLIGFVIYFGYGRKHSVLQREREGVRADESGLTP